MARIVALSTSAIVFNLSSSPVSFFEIHQQQSQHSFRNVLPCTERRFARACRWQQRRRVLCQAEEQPKALIQMEPGHIVRDEEWERQRREESRELERRRQQEKNEEAKKEVEYRKIGLQLKGYPPEEISKVKRSVASWIRAGEEVEEMIVEAADKGELTPLVLLVIRNRLELARQDDERDAIQALDLLYRRVEMEMLQREASPAMQLLNELLNLHSGFSDEEWLQRSRKSMLKIFPPEDVFSFIGPPGMDLSTHMGPIEVPEEDDVLLRIDFIREVDELLAELESQPEIQPVSGFDAQSVAIRLRQQEKLRTIQQVKDLRKLAATLTW